MLVYFGVNVWQCKNALRQIIRAKTA